MPLPTDVIVSTLVRLLAALAIGLWLFPRYAFEQFPALPRLDRLASNAIRGALFLMATGYILAAAHLFEFLTVLSAMVVAVLWRALRNRTRPRAGQLSGRLRLTASLLELLDEAATLPRQLLAQSLAGLRSGLRRLPRPGLYGLAALVVGLGLLAVSAWLRLWSNLAHAAPPYSDFVVVLAWVKEVAEQRLFPGGIYPEGFHIFAAVLIKLGFIQTIPLVKFYGPVVGVGMVVSVAYFAYRAAGRLAPAFLAGLVYGTLPALLPYEYRREAGTDSQEFGTMLVLPCAWFVYMAWTHPKERGYRITALAFLAVAALVHPVGAVDAVTAALAATLAAWIARGIDGGTFRWFVQWLAAALVLTMAPLGIALALGKPLYASSAQFATQTTTAAAPPLMPAQLAGFAAVGLLLAVRLLRRRRWSAAGVPLMGLWLLVFSDLIQQAPRFGIHSAAIAARSGELAALAAAAALGLGWSALEELIGWGLPPRACAWVSLVGVAALTVVAWKQMPPQPFDPYTMNSSELVAAYVRINEDAPPTDWLAVSTREGYDYSFGDGQFMSKTDFAAHVPADTPADWPEYREPDGRLQPIGIHQIYLFVNKRFHVAPFASSRARLPQREADNAALAHWVAAWQQHHGPIPVYFDGPDMRIYELSRPRSAQSNLNALFGS